MMSGLKRLCFVVDLCSLSLVVLLRNAFCSFEKERERKSKEVAGVVTDTHRTSE
jgi:hypothetical protein